MSIAEVAVVSDAKMYLYKTKTLKALLTTFSQTALSCRRARCGSALLVGE